MIMLSFIIDNDNNLIWADEQARQILGLPERGNVDVVSGVFGLAHLYQRIEQESFNYRWAGQLKVVLPNGDPGTLQGRARQRWYTIAWR